MRKTIKIFLVIALAAIFVTGCDFNKKPVQSTPPPTENPENSDNQPNMNP